MFKKSFDISSLPITFYAHTLQFIERNSYDKRCAVMFEAIMKDQIEMFISGKLPTKLPPVAEQCECFAPLWRTFEKDGIEGTEFMSEKGGYLLKVPNAELDLLLQSFADAKEIENARNDWWEITVCAPLKGTEEDKEDTCILCVTGFLAAEGEMPFTIKPVSYETEKALYSLYTPYWDDTAERICKSNNDAQSVGAINQNTVFGSVRVMCVGAALCSRLSDAAGNVVGYFDLGRESSLSTKRLRKGAPASFIVQLAHMQSAYQVIEQDLLNTQGLTIIISHWHTDHIMILNDMLNHPSSTDFWQQVSIFCPETTNSRSWAVTYYTRVCAAISDAGNTNFFPYPYANADVSWRITSLPSNLTIYKCDRDDTNIRNPNHHNHGIYAVITLKSGSVVFLAGDCAYDTIAVNDPSHTIIDNSGVGYNVLVASHHGGRYSNATAPIKKLYIPLPRIGVFGTVVYSANGVAYKHPTQCSITDHRSRGWVWGAYTHLLQSENNYINII